MIAARRSLLTIGILNLIAAIAFYFGSKFYVGMAWLGAYDLYAALDMNHIIDQEKLAAYEGGRYAKQRELGEHLITYPSRAALDMCDASAALLALNGVVLCIATVATAGSPGRPMLPLAAPSDPPKK